MNDPDQEVFLETQARHVRQCAKEGRMVLIIWLFALITIASVMISMGYVPPDERPDIPPLICGIPSWVVWGLFAPWIVLIAVTWWFAISYFKDDEPLHEFPDLSDFS